MSKSMQHFQDAVEKAIAVSQKEFEKYQKECFPKRPPEFFCLELNGEAGELANKEKKLWKGKNIEHAELADEAADVFIALMNYSNSRSIELGKAVAYKLEKIEEKRLLLKEKGEAY
jgi:NTP pyrophosphatase (non-canonical NTP hydrolase)